MFLGSFATTTQAFIPASMLSGIAVGSQITGMAFRLDSSASTSPASDLTWTNYDIVLSQPSATFSTNTATPFASNLGADATAVRSGSLTITAGSYTGGGSPNPFGPFILFTTPYTYTGTALVIQIRSSGASGADFVLDSDANFLGTELLNGAGYAGTTGSSSIGRIPVTELQFGPAQSGVPEPGSLSLFAAEPLPFSYCAGAEEAAKDCFSHGGRTPWSAGRSPDRPLRGPYFWKYFSYHLIDRSIKST